MPDLLVENISKSFPTVGEPLRILTDVSLSLSRGESLAILGPSGSGKSTLLSILGTLEPPSSGNVLLDGQDPFTIDPIELATFRSQKIGFVFQDHHLLPQCTVLENVLVPFLADGSAGAEEQSHALQLLDRAGLADRLDHRPAELSGGERQRVAIIRALVRQPTLILADEPTGNLDRHTASAIAQVLLELPQEQQAMLILATHSESLASQMQQRSVLDLGRLQSQNTC